MTWGSNVTDEEEIQADLDKVRDLLRENKRLRKEARRYKDALIRASVRLDQATPLVAHTFWPHLRNWSEEARAAAEAGPDE